MADIASERLAINKPTGGSVDFSSVLSRIDNSGNSEDTTNGMSDAIVGTPGGKKSEVTSGLRGTKSQDEKNQERAAFQEILNAKLEKVKSADPELFKAASAEEKEESFLDFMRSRVVSMDEDVAKDIKSVLVEMRSYIGSPDGKAYFSSEEGRKAIEFAFSMSQLTGDDGSKETVAGVTKEALNFIADANNELTNAYSKFDYAQDVENIIRGDNPSDVIKSVKVLVEEFGVEAFTQNSKFLRDVKTSYGHLGTQVRDTVQNAALAFLGKPLSREARQELADSDSVSYRGQSIALDSLYDHLKDEIFDQVKGKVLEKLQKDKSSKNTPDYQARVQSRLDRYENVYKAKDEDEARAAMAELIKDYTDSEGKALHLETVVQGAERVNKELSTAISKKKSKNVFISRELLLGNITRGQAVSVSAIRWMQDTYNRATQVAAKPAPTVNQASIHQYLVEQRAKVRHDSRNSTEEKRVRFKFDDGTTTLGEKELDALISAIPATGAASSTALTSTTANPLSFQFTHENSTATPPRANENLDTIIPSDFLAKLQTTVQADRTARHTSEVAESQRVKTEIEAAFNGLIGSGDIEVTTANNALGIDAYTLAAAGTTPGSINDKQWNMVANLYKGTTSDTTKGIIHDFATDIFGGTKYDQTTVVDRATAKVFSPGWNFQLDERQQRRDLANTIKSDFNSAIRDTKKELKAIQDENIRLEKAIAVPMLTMSKAIAITVANALSDSIVDGEQVADFLQGGFESTLSSLRDEYVGDLEAQVESLDTYKDEYLVALQNYEQNSGAKVGTHSTAEEILEAVFGQHNYPQNIRALTLAVDQLKADNPYGLSTNITRLTEQKYLDLFSPEIGAADDIQNVVRRLDQKKAILEFLQDAARLGDQHASNRALKAQIKAAGSIPNKTEISKFSGGYQQITREYDDKLTKLENARVKISDMKNSGVFEIEDEGFQRVRDTFMARILNTLSRSIGGKGSGRAVLDEIVSRINDEQKDPDNLGSYEASLLRSLQSRSLKAPRNTLMSTLASY
jgi:hypothetical protein